jgi:hypothetical protein
LLLVLAGQVVALEIKALTVQTADLNPSLPSVAVAAAVLATTELQVVQAVGLVFKPPTDLVDLA